MLPLQQWILEQIPELRTLCEKYTYQFPNFNLENFEKDVLDFMVRTPIIGPFSAGKTSLINALLGEKLLSVELTPETAFPAEIRYAEEEFFILLQDGKKKKILKKTDLKNTEEFYGENHNFLFDIRLPNADLKAFPHLCIVDLPGWDSGIEKHSQAIDNYVKKSIAYILVISVEDGTLPQTIQNLLSELRLHKMEVGLLISKSDLKPQQDTEAVLEKISQELKTIMGKNPFEARFVSARKKQIEGFKEILFGLEKKTEKIFHSKYGFLFSEVLQQIHEFLKIQLNEENFDAESIELEKENLKKDLETIEKTLESETESLRGEIQLCRKNILNEIETSLCGSLEELTWVIYNNGDVNGLVGTKIRIGLSNGLDRDFYPRLQKYFSRVEEAIPNSLSFSFHLNLKLPDEDIDTSGLRRSIMEGIVDLLEILKIQYPALAKFIPALKELLKIFISKSEKKIQKENQLEYIRGEVLNHIIPESLRQLYPSIDKILREQTDRAEDEIRKKIMARKENIENGLKHLEEELKTKKESFEKKQGDIEKDCMKITAMLRDLLKKESSEGIK